MLPSVSHPGDLGTRRPRSECRPAQPTLCGSGGAAVPRAATRLSAAQLPGRLQKPGYELSLSSLSPFGVLMACLAVSCSSIAARGLPVRSLPG